MKARNIFWGAVEALAVLLLAAVPAAASDPVMSFQLKKQPDDKEP